MITACVARPYMVPLGCVGILSCVGALLAAKMSHLRLSGAVGKGDPKSTFEWWHLRQLLHAEWCAIILPAFIASPLCGLQGLDIDASIIAVTMGRIGYVLDAPGKARCYACGVAYAGVFYLTARIIVTVGASFT